MDCPKNCKTCGRYTAHAKKIFGNDGVCKLILKKPVFVKESHGCQYWIDARLLKGGKE